VIPDPEGPVTLATRHVVIPAALIALVASFLFYLLEVRAVLLGGTTAIKLVGFCFAAATVLIARYGKVSAIEERQGCYTVFMAGALFLFLLKSSGLGGFLPSLLIVAAVWRFATGVTGALSFEGELEPDERRNRLYGVERLRLEQFRRQQQEEEGAAWGLFEIVGRRLKPNHGNPVVAVARLSALALLGFALGEPLLLRATPEVTARALTDVVVFLFSAAVVLAAGSAAGTLRHTLAANGRVSPAVLPVRVGAAALLAVIVLATALALPGVHFQGQGRPRASSAPGEAGPGDDQSGRRRSPQPGGDGGEAPLSMAGNEPRLEPSPSQKAAAAGSLPGGRLLGLLGELGKVLRILVVIVVALLALYAFVHLRLRLPGLKGLLDRLLAWLRGLLPKRQPRPEAVEDPFAGMAALASLPPRAAILAAYRRLLAAFEQAGHPRAERTAPFEYLDTLPPRLQPVAAAAQGVTDLYVAAAYGGAEPTAGDRDRALAGLAAIAARRELLRPVAAFNS
jgi:hypothetical protein